LGKELETVTVTFLVKIQKVGKFKGDCHRQHPLDALLPKEAQPLEGYLNGCSFGGTDNHKRSVLYVINGDCHLF
jgi:hypothetical protein